MNSASATLYANVNSDRRRRADGHRDHKEDVEDPQEKADRRESVSSARFALDRESRTANLFFVGRGAVMVGISSSTRRP
jgi:hypothetical protein